MNRIKELREQRGLAQSALAEAVGASQRSIGNWEADIASPTIEDAARIADYFCVTLDYLFCRAESGAVSVAFSSLSDAETELMASYRALQPEGKAALGMLMRQLSRKGGERDRD